MVVVITLLAILVAFTLSHYYLCIFPDLTYYFLDSLSLDGPIDHVYSKTQVVPLLKYDFYQYYLTLHYRSDHTVLYAYHFFTTVFDLVLAYLDSNKKSVSDYLCHLKTSHAPRSSQPTLPSPRALSSLKSS